MKKSIVVLITIGTNICQTAFCQKLSKDALQYVSSNKQISYVSLSADVKTSAILAKLKESLTNPLLIGKTEQVGIMLFADSAFTFNEMEHLVVSPAHIAYDEIKQIPHSVVNQVKTGTEIFGCSLTPWKVGHCSKDIFKSVTRTWIETVTIHHDAINEVIKDIAVPTIKIQQTLTPISGNIEYTVSYDDIDVNFIENQYTVSATFTIDLKANLNLDIIPKTITPKGTLGTSMQCKIVQSGFIGLDDAGKISISNPISKFSVIKGMNSEFVINAINFANKIDGISAFVEDLMGSLINNALNDAIKSAINKNIEKLNVKGKALALVKQICKPVPIDGYGYLYPNVTTVLISQPIGRQINNENEINIKFGVCFQPFATVQRNLQPIDLETPLSFGTTLNEPNLIHVSLPVFVDYAFLATELQPYVDAFNDKFKNTFFISNYSLSPPVISYQDQNNIKLSISLLHRSNKKELGVISCDAQFNINRQDTSIYVKLFNVKIKPTSLIMLIAKPLINYEVSKQEEKIPSFKFSGDVKTAITQLNKKLFIQSPLGTIKGITNKLELNGLGIYPDYILLNINLDGDLNYN